MSRCTHADYCIIAAVEARQKGTVPVGARREGIGPVPVYRTVFRCHAHQCHMCTPAQCSSTFCRSSLASRRVFHVHADQVPCAHTVGSRPLHRASHVFYRAPSAKRPPQTSGRVPSRELGSVPVLSATPPRLSRTVPPLPRHKIVFSSLAVACGASEMRRAGFHRAVSSVPLRLHRRHRGALVALVHSALVRLRINFHPTLQRIRQPV